MVSGYAVQPSDIRYVSVNGNDSNDGLTEATPWRRISTAAARAEPGQVVFVRAGRYTGEEIAFVNSGTADRPIQIVGYTTVPGDHYPVTGAIVPGTLDAATWPLVDGGDRATGTALTLSNRSHLIIRNLQIANYEQGVYGVNTHHVQIDNVSAIDFGDLDAALSGVGIKMGTGSDDNKISNSVVMNSAHESIAVYGDRNSIIACEVYADDDSTGIKSATDYYIMVGGDHNTVRGSLVHRLKDLPHGGHGIGTKRDAQYNLIEDNLAINFAGTAYYVRHRGSRFNTFRNNIARDGRGIGFAARDGASDNLIEGMTIEDIATGVAFFDTSEDGGLQSGGDDNEFVNLTLRNIGGAAIRFYHYSYTDTTSTGNVFDRLEVNGAGYLFDVSHTSIDTLIRNSLISNVSNYARFGTGKSTQDLGVSFEQNQFSGNGFAAP